MDRSGHRRTAGMVGLGALALFAAGTLNALRATPTAPTPVVHAESPPPPPPPAAPPPAAEPPPTVDQTIVRQAIAALEAGDAATLSTLLRAHPGLATARVADEAQPYNGYFHHATLLHHLAGNPVPKRVAANAVELATLLLDAGAAVDARTDGGPDQLEDPGWTTLCLAATASDQQIGDRRAPLIALLIARGADVNDADGLPLSGALCYDVDQGIAVLLAHRARLDLRLAAGVGDAAAVAACFAADGTLKPGLPQLSRYPLPPGPPPDTVTRLGEAMVLAASRGHAAIVATLLDRGAPIDLMGDATALHHAAFSDHREIVRLLLDRGANPTLRDPQYHGTPAGWAEYAKHPECVVILRAAEERYAREHPLAAPAPVEDTRPPPF